MNLTRRGFMGGCALLGAASASAGAHVSRGAAGYSLNIRKGLLRISIPGLAEEVRFVHASDTHLALRDGRDDAYADNCARMAQWPGSPEAFSATLAKAKERRVDFVALTGDTVSFPTLANVEFVARELEKSGVPWMYTAGNHDWHFEGDAGTDAEQRTRWIAKRLMPLYPAGVDPLMYSRVVKGVRFVAIDDSHYDITERQLEFWRAEASKGDPVVLLMHVPVWVDGFGVETVGCPDWGAASDTIWRIERRMRWAERQSSATFAFRESVLSCDNLVGVFTGHIHRGLNACERGRFLMSVPQNNEGYFWDVRIVPAS